ncbi:uncharacterized protein [Triticum aestivum]|uniref:uncharacterized protein n=1 Tax=Triticum aestivum TaxID=4565 RepID=UPI001D01B044|nr:uncharacterized protein LOC123084323 [Triticum aestivum]
MRQWALIIMISSVFYTDPNTREFMRLLKEQHQKAAESDELSQSSMRPKWDTPFNRALNILKKVPVDKSPSYGRVHGVGDGASWKTCYLEEPEERRKRWLVITQESIDEKVAIAVNKTKAETKEELVRVVNAALTNMMASLWAIFNWLKSNPNPWPEDFPLPSFVGSNSVTTTSTTPAQATAKVPVPIHSSPTSISGMLDGPSSLGELDALMADDTPCTLLYDIKGEKVAVRKATIVKPKDRMFHNREMPDGVFKVNVANVLAGFEDFPPLIPVDDDNETPKMIGA